MVNNRKNNNFQVNVIVVDWLKYWGLFLYNEKCYILNYLIFGYRFKKIYSLCKYI